MIELFLTKDAVTISFVESLLRDSGTDCFIADQNMNVFDSLIGILRRSIMIAENDATEARQLLTEAGIEHEIR